MPNENTIQEVEKQPHVLLVDDDTALQASLREFLEGFGYQVSVLSDGRQIREFLADTKPDIILLDVMMPGIDGFSVLRHIRQFQDAMEVPVIMLTARGEETDRIVGLELGADDYVPKPFNPRELLARIKAVLRRAPLIMAAGAQEHAQGQGAASASGGIPAGQVIVGDICLDCNRQILRRAEKSVDLSTAEFHIIRAFMSHAGQVLSRDAMLTLAFGPEHFVSDRNIDVYISRIRAILRAVGAEASTIKTVWGSGYLWRNEGGEGAV